MINQHCTHDVLFGYCKREPTPDYDIDPTIHNVTDKEGKPVGSWLSGGHCRLIKEDCSFFTTYKEMSGNIKDIENPQLRIIHKDGTVTTEDKNKGKGNQKKVKKEKKVAAQGSFF